MTPRTLSKAFVVIYWIALPLFALLAAGSALGAALAEPPVVTLWATPLVSVAISVLISWRLYLHHRALAASRPIIGSDIELFSDTQESEKTE